MKVIKKYRLFWGSVLVIVLCLLQKNSFLTVPIVSNLDSQISFVTECEQLEQTWQPHVKKITGIKVPYSSTESFNATVEVNIYSDNYEKHLVAAELEYQFIKGEEGVLEFSFDPVQVTPGERYRIHLAYTNYSSPGELLIPSGSNYEGCNIDGEECNVASAIEIVIVKNSHLFWLFAVFFPILAFSLLFMVIFDRKWEDTVALSLIIIVFGMYVFGLFECLQEGVVTLYALSIISFLIALYLLVKKQVLLKELISPGLLVYGILFGIILLNCRGIWLARWDEYSHWGLAVKDMFYYDAFAKHYNTTVMLPRYLPFSTLIEYFFVRANGMFSQEIVYVAYQTVLLSASIIISRVAKKAWRFCIPTILVIIALPMIFFSDVYNCIYVDPLLAVFAAYILICYYSEKMSLFNLLRIMGGLFALTMTKDMGMVIAGLITMIMFFDRIRSIIQNRKHNCKELILPCVLAGWVLISFFSWQVYLSIPTPVSDGDSIVDVDLETEQQAESTIHSGAISASGITIEGVRALLDGSADSYKYQSVKNFLVMMFDEETFKFGSIGLSFIDLQMLLLLITFILSYKENESEEKNKLLSFGKYSCIAGLLYSIILEILYLFAFSKNEALHLSSHDRYLASWICGVIFVLLYLFMQQVEKGKWENKRIGQFVMVILVAAIIMCFPMTNLIVTNRDTEVTEEMIYGNNQIEEMMRSTSIRGEKIYFICNNGDGYSYFIFKNTSCPLLVSSGDWDIYSSEDAYEKQMKIMEEHGEDYKGNKRILSCEEWGKELSDCQYVFLYHPAEIFGEMYGSMFKEPETIEDGTFYRVENTNNGIELAFIGKVGLKTYR